ncbi:hypothetical protein [Sphingopyxis terrae]|uniref:hypothetical protein n=1 Tax=Sphingopyxis terrae TaxID=33052 RepID=UPI001C2C3AE0|nr:hypothetical protein [Sphingopyxis terrae]QXF12342.1 hypothetical protein HBA51_09395 [Sphingopyxis terrae subsp. terrae]
MQSNNQNFELAMLIGVLMIVVAIIQFIATLILIGIILVSGVLTLLSFWAWNQPRTLFGEVITPDEARGFVGRGVCGGFIAFIVGQLYAVIQHVNITDNWYALIILGGYFLGSVVIGAAIEEERAKAEASVQEILPPLAPPPPPPQFTQRPFEFADWKDEEEFR